MYQFSMSIYALYAEPRIFNIVQRPSPFGNLVGLNSVMKYYASSLGYQREMIAALRERRRRERSRQIQERKLKKFLEQQHTDESDRPTP